MDDYPNPTSCDGLSQEDLRCDLLDLRLKQRSVWVQSFAKVAKVHQGVTSLVETEAVR